MTDTSLFDKYEYVKKLTRLLQDLEVAKVSGDDVEPILEAIEKEIDAYVQYKKSKSSTTNQ